MILAGALGNLWDRVMYDAVRDLFLLFPGVNLPFGWSWPVVRKGSTPGSSMLLMCIWCSRLEPLPSVSIKHEPNNRKQHEH